MSRWIWVGVGLVSLTGCGGQAKVAEAEAEPQLPMTEAVAEPAQAAAAAPGELDNWEDADPQPAASSGDVGFEWNDRTTTTAEPAGGGAATTADAGGRETRGIGGTTGGSLDDDLEDFQWAGETQESRFAADRPAPRTTTATEFDDLEEIPFALEPSTAGDERGSDSGAEAAAVPVLVDRDGGLLVDLEEVQDPPIDIEETMVEPALIDIEETMVEPEAMLATETVDDGETLMPFAELAQSDEPGPYTMWLDARSAEEMALEEAAVIVVLEETYEQPFEDESLVEIVERSEAETTASDAAPTGDADGSGVGAAAALVLAPIVADDEWELEPVEEPMVEEMILVIEESAGDESDLTIIDITDVTPAATQPPPPAVIAWELSTPRDQMPEAEGLPRLDGTVGVVHGTGDWLYRSLIDTLVTAGCAPVSGRNSDFAIAVRVEPRDAFRPAKAHTIGVSLPYHRGRADLPRTRWLATIDVVIDEWDDSGRKRQALQEVSIRVGSQGITGRDFDRYDLRNLQQVIEQWADMVAPLIAE